MLGWTCSECASYTWNIVITEKHVVGEGGGGQPQEEHAGPRHEQRDQQPCEAHPAVPQVQEQDRHLPLGEPLLSTLNTIFVLKCLSI